MSVSKIVSFSVDLEMATLYCVELGFRQEANLCRMTSSIILQAESADDAEAYVERSLPNLLTKVSVQRVFTVTHVVVNWPLGTVDILETE